VTSPADRSRAARLLRGALVAGAGVGLLSVLRRRGRAQDAARPTVAAAAQRPVEVAVPVTAARRISARDAGTVVARGGVVAGALLGLVAIVLGAICLVTGARPMIFRSGSMAPSITTGSLAFTRDAAAADLRVGDVVTVPVDGTRVTHRIIAVAHHGGVALLELKGDANRAADRTIYPVRDVQRTWFSMPYAGRIVAGLGTPLGGLALAAYLLFAILVLSAWSGASGRRSPATAAGALLRTRVLALSTAVMTLAGAGMGGWALPTWASWTDNANVSGSTIATGTWDVAAPSSSVTNVSPAVNAAGWYNANITVTLTATDPAPSSGVAGIHYKLNNGAEQVLTGATGTVSITTEGTNTLEFWAVDNAGFVESPHNTATFKLDKTAPVAPTFSSISNDTGSSSTDLITNVATQTLTGGAEPNSTVTVKQGSVVLGTTTANSSGVFTYGPVTLAAGTNTFTATATDIAGNVSPTSTNFVVTLDGVSPNSVVIAPNDSAWHTTNTWTVTASDALSGVVSIAYKIGSAAFTTVAASNGVAVSPPTLPDGTNTVQAYATDVAGNSTSASAVTATIKVDTVKPTAVLNLTGTTGTNGWQLGGGANVVGTDATSGVASVAYKIDSGSFTTVASGTGFTIPDGTHTVTFHAVDVAGNVGTDVVQTVKVDSTAPVTTAAGSPAANTNGWNNSAVTVTFSPTDATSGVASVAYRTTLNGGTPSSFTTLTGPTYTASVSAQGTTLVEYRATDNAGNVETLKSITVKVDTVAPTATLNVTGSIINSPWHISGSANIVGADATSGVDHVEYAVDGSTTFTSVASGATFTIPDGTHSVTYRAVDLAGNVGTNQSTSSIQVDSVPPVLSNPLPADGSTGGSWTTLSCSSTNQVCVNATDATSGVSSVKVALVRTSTNECFNGTAFVAGSACSVTMAVATAPQYRTSGLTAALMTTGTYTATYTATDVAGNSVTLTTSFSITIAAPVLSCGTTGKKFVTISWTAVAGATSYDVYAPNGTTLKVNQTGTTYTLNVVGESGTVRVYARNAAGQGPASNVLTYDVGNGSNTGTCS
jgi:signal peptidase I